MSWTFLKKPTRRQKQEKDIDNSKVSIMQKKERKPERLDDHVL